MKKDRKDKIGKDTDTNQHVFMFSFLGSPEATVR
jgi:hypothetical protein